MYRFTLKNLYLVKYSTFKRVNALWNTALTTQQCFECLSLPTINIIQCCTQPFCCDQAQTVSVNDKVLVSGADHWKWYWKKLLCPTQATYTINLWSKIWHFCNSFGWTSHTISHKVKILKVKKKRFFF